jgi:nitrogen fixation NifU-like protein
MSLSGVKQFPMRIKCATMAWHTLTLAMSEKNNNE